MTIQLEFPKPTDPLAPPTAGTQSAEILLHLQRLGPITPMDALRLYGCLRLAARIADLRAAGYPIKSSRAKANGKTFARYELRK